ncbi:MAG TPA: hypothetical protein EYQ60_11070 [Myxococcales bacterium]|nr:hypothetical protein [Myxococcales bacterium]
MNFLSATSGPLSPSILGGYFELTCAEVQESFDQRALWLAAYQPHFDQQLVFIESATELVAPGVPSFSWIGAALLSCLLPVVAWELCELARHGAPLGI